MVKNVSNDASSEFAVSPSYGPALTHVQYWADKSWEPITAEEAKTKFPYGTSAYSRTFMCGACGKFVLLTREGRNVAHFRHTVSSANADCPDYRRNEYQDYIRSGAFYRERSLPIRIKFSKGYDFSFELGLLPVPNEIFDSLPRSMIRVVCRPSGEAFSYSSDRLRAGQITWVSIGSRFPQNVSIHVQQEGTSPLSQWWPGEISGVRSDAAGVLFDGLTNKLLPADADVVTEHPYWLLTDEWVSRNSFGTQLSVEPIASGLGTGSRFELFRVTAGGYDETAAKFFLRFRARLTEKPAMLVPLWPPTVRAPHLLCHDADRLFIAKKGNARIEVYPPPRSK